MYNTMKFTASAGEHQTARRPALLGIALRELQQLGEQGGPCSLNLLALGPTDVYGKQPFAR